MENLLYKLAHSFNQTTGIEFDELLSQCRYAYLIALRTFDSRRNVKLSTYVYNVVHNELIKFIRQEKKYTDKKVDLENHENFIAGPNFIEVDKNLNKFPEDVRQLIQCIFSHANELDFSKSQRWNKAKVAKLMERELGWGQRKRKAAVRKLKQILADTPENELF